jgi:hypothetical protein
MALRRLVLAACLVISAGCTEAAEARSAPPPAMPAPVPAAEPDPTPEADGLEEPTTTQRATLAVDGTKTDGSTFRVAGRILDASVPGVFRLRAENGCRHETKLRTVTTGIAFDVELDATALADAFGCAVDVEAGDDLSDSFAISPDGTATRADSGLALDPGFSLVAADLDGASGDLVRFAVSAGSPVVRASVDLAGIRYEARITPDGIVADLPARAWASAAIAGASATVDVELEGGVHRSLTVAAEAHVERVIGCED